MVSPEVWASRWRTVAPGGPASVSRSTAPSSTAIWAARAANGLVTEANANGRRRSPWPASRPSGPMTAAAAWSTGQSSIASSVLTSLPGEVVELRRNPRWFPTSVPSRSTVAQRHRPPAPTRRSSVFSRLADMSQTVRGVISRAKNQPVELVDIVIPDPGPGEVVVDITACGVCHTDLTYRDGGINDDYPFLLGHEAAGTVEAVGSGVTAVAPGDFVSLNWRAVCGQCRACKRGRPHLCFDTFNAEQPMTLTDGTALSPALGIGAFADKTLVHAGQCTKVDENADPAVVGLLGCGVMAGVGAAINTGAVTRDDTVAVIGCGGVGDAAIAGAKLVGAKKIIAVDTDNTKLDWARDFGATHTINARELDVVETIQDLTGGFGADVVIDAVGRPETWKQAFYARDLAGTVVLVGVPTPEMRLDMPLVDFFSHGGSLKSSWYGDCLPERDFPTLVDLYRQGRLPLEKFVTERIELGDVEAAFTKMHSGEVLRSVVIL